MLKWVPYAFLRITFFFALGIISAIYLGEYLAIRNTFILLIALFFAYLILRFILVRNRFYSYNWLQGFLAFSTIFFLGYLNLHLNNESRHENHLIKFDNISHYKGIIDSPPEEKANTYKYDFKISKVYIDSVWKEASGKIYLYVKKGEPLFNYGHSLLIKGSPDEISPPMNPGEFNYKRFLTFRNVYLQDYLTSNYVIAGDVIPSTILNYAYSIRKHASETLSTYVKSEREVNIAKALILGVKDGLNSEIENAYSASGAMHVLAVSGLHVGIVYGIILLLFKPFRKTKTVNWSLALTSLLVLWSYALITGFSPSVLRAVTMFSFIAIATASGRSTNIYNTLAASGCILLLFDPYLIMSVGFQLSFLAVFGIVYIQPRIYNLLSVDNYFLDKVWAITAVSIAAQIATMALTILYFHQFPTFFLASNLVVIPGAFIILCLGLLLLVVSPLNALANAIGWVLQGVIWTVNYLVFKISEIPYSQITDVQITTFQSWLIIFVIIGMLFLFERKRFSYLIFSFLCVVSFSAIEWRQTQLNKDNRSLIFYRVNNHMTIGFKEGLNLNIFTDSAFAKDSEGLMFHTRPSRLEAGITNHSIKVFDKANYSSKGNFKAFTSGGKSFLILDHDDYGELKNRANFDYIVLAEKFNKEIKWIVENFDFEKIILDGSLKWYRANSLKDELIKNQIDYYSVYHDGALKIKID